MNNRIYLIPGVIGWTFKTSDTECTLCYAQGGPSVPISPDFSAKDIASRAQIVLCFSFHESVEASGIATEGMLKIDWQAMIREAGTDVQHQSPGLPGWTLKISDLGTWLWHIAGAGVPITEDTPISEIADAVRRVLLPILPPVEIDVQVDEVMQIDFRALILNAWAPRAAPLLEGCTADNTAFVESICADVRQLVLMQNADSTALGNEICALVKTLA